MNLLAELAIVSNLMSGHFRLAIEPLFLAAVGHMKEISRYKASRASPDQGIKRRWLFQRARERFTAKVDLELANAGGVANRKTINELPHNSEILLNSLE